MSEVMYTKLRGVIVSRYGNYSNFAEAIGVKRQSVSRKLTGGVQFNKKDIELWSNALGIDPEDCGAYFFNF